MSRASVLVALAALAACSRAPKPVPAPKLQDAARDASAGGACGRLIPSQWTPSWPVPVVEKGAVAYKLFFFGRDGDPRAGFTFHGPEGDAVIDGAGAVLSCSRRAQAGAPIPRLPASGESLDAVLADERALYARTEDVAVLFAAGKPLDDAGRRRVADFADAFGRRIDPGHAAAYLALNPAFWSWVAANGGVPPK